MTIKYGLQIFFFELTDNDGQNFLAGIVHKIVEYNVFFCSTSPIKGPNYLKSLKLA
jgi:hypothetical protein